MSALNLAAVIAVLGTTAVNTNYLKNFYLQIANFVI